MRTLLGMMLFASTAVAAPVPPPMPPNPMGKAWLGIYDDRKPQPGVWVGELVANAPARQAKVETGDRIDKIGNTKVTQFEDVVTLMGQYRPGATIELTLTRGDKELKVKVYLTERPETFPAPTQNEP